MTSDGGGTICEDFAEHSGEPDIRVDEFTSVGGTAEHSQYNEFIVGGTIYYVRLMPVTRPELLTEMR